MISLTLKPAVKAFPGVPQKKKKRMTIEKPQPKHTSEKNEWRWLQPTGRSGNAQVQHFYINRDAYLGQIMSYDPFPVPVGWWSRLVLDGRTMMSNSPMERFTCRDFLKAATGDVLIAGLGLGLVVRQLIDRESVTSITVLENNPHVIRLVGRTVRHKKVKVIEADAFTYETDRRFDCIWLDIWFAATEEYTPERRSLAGRYRRFKRNPDSFLKTWGLTRR